MGLVNKLIILGIAIVIVYWLFFEFHILEVISDGILNLIKTTITHTIDSIKNLIGSYF